MLTIRDYADSHHITYEAVRRQIARYSDELGEHVIVKGNRKYLDDFAVEFLDDHRQDRPIIVADTSRDEQIAAAEAENKNLLIKIAELQERLLASQASLIDAQKLRLEAAALEESKKEVQTNLDRAQDEISSLKRVLSDSEALQAQQEEKIKQAKEAEKRAYSEVQRLQEALAAEKARADAAEQKSWWQKLIGR